MPSLVYCVAVDSDTRNSVEMRHDFGFYEGPQLLLPVYRIRHMYGGESSSPMEKVTRQPLEMRWQCIQYTGYSKHKHLAYWMKWGDDTYCVEYLPVHVIFSIFFCLSPSINPLIHLVLPAFPIV